MHFTNLNNDKAIKEQEQLLIDTKKLQKMLNCGYATAVNIGDSATARVKIGKRVLWSVKAIEDYIDTVRE
ncbi:MAG: hypothetical protein IJG85_05100 [Eubacteriaceae bacterium]|nr:hypothetical protein [Eubacteriaceae bacterium]